MKTSFAAVLSFSIAASVCAQTGGPGTAQTSPQDTPYTEVNRDANSSVWERTTYEQGPSGEITPQVHRYVEMATGMHYLNDGQWVDSKEEIDVLPAGGAAATQGQHQGYFPGDIYQGQIELVTPSGQQLKSRPIGLSYFDGQNSVLIAELTNSAGVIVGSNQVVYPNAFTGFKADLCYTYTKSGFEQDVILREAPPTPESYGLNPATARLQVLTEFFSPPQPTIQSSVLPPQAGLTLTDQTLGFGDTEMIRGRAFLIGADANDGSVLVSKQWLLMNGRQILVEEVPVNAIINGLAALPSTAMNRVSRKALRTASPGEALPPQRLAKDNPSKIMTLAKAGLSPTTGFVLDYQTVNGSLTNLTFQGDTTYYISGFVNLYGTNTFEGGTVIKYASNGSLSTDGSLICNTAPYRPAVFTSMDDNSIGDTISGSSGTPVIGSSTYLNVNSDSIDNLHYLRFAYAGVALQADNENVRDSQFVNCNETILVWHNMSFYNVLFGHCDYAISPIYGGTIVGENLTTDSNLMDGTTTTLCLTNCILADQVFAGTINASHNISTVNLGISGIVQVSGPLFQTTGAGSYYLTNGSTFRNYGTTNIDASLLTDLAQKTTYPPLVYTNVVFSNNITFSVQAQRDFDTPDIGYHYDPIDYLVDDCWITNATLNVTNGTIIACYNDSGIVVTDGSAINSVGTVLAQNWFTTYSCVQEQPTLLGSTPSTAECVNSWHSSTRPGGYYRFSKFSSLAGGGWLLYHNSNWAYSNLLVEDCEFWGGKNDFTGNSSTTTVLKNNLFARSPISTSSTGYTNNSLITSNNLFWNISFSIQNGANSNIWYFFNNDFDNTRLTGLGSHPAVNGYNGYIGNTNQLNPPGAGNVVSTNAIGYQSGPLGYFYQPTNSILINQGGATADLVGLYHYTTTTNQVIESSSKVDIGYHYVALDGNGAPLDSNGDGVPDYLEDANGNGLVDIGEIPFGITIDNPVNGTVIY